MSNNVWLFIAFLAAWAIIGGYVYSLGARQRRLEERVDSLERPRS